MRYQGKFNPAGAQAGIYRENHMQVNTMANDTTAPCVASSSATLVFITKR